MLARRLRRWPNNQPTLGERLVFVGNVIDTDKSWLEYSSQIFTNIRAED